MTRWISQNRGIARHPLIRASARLADAELVFGRGAKRCRIDPGSDTFIGWGLKGSGLWAMEQARLHGAPFRLFEDGFVRSLKPGYGEGALYSIVEDSTGIYYDGTGESDLVRSLEDETFPDGDTFQETVQCDLDRYRATGASKYNWYPDEFVDGAIDRLLPEPGVLVVDQTFGDASIRHGGLEESDFHRMLEAAVGENPGVPVYLRGHPDHLYRSKRSCLRSPLLADPQVRLIPASLAPWQVFEQIDRTYVGTSLLGLEALVHGCRVTTFGLPFYAGWGLTDDRHPRARSRARTRTLPEVFRAAFCHYSRYFDPDTQEPCPLSRILDHLELQKNRFRENAGSWLGWGMSPWKRPLMRRYLTSPAADIRQTRSPGRAARWIEVDPGIRVLAWGRNGALPPACENSDGVAGAEPGTETSKNAEACPLFRVEDGFLRSTGLGAEFHTPLSLIFDPEGIYFDATAPSRLESILRDRDFSPDELLEAENLTRFILSKSLTKYNLAGAQATAGKPPDADLGWPKGGAGSRILVPGQVELDASIRWGSPSWQTNADLLREVRRRRPDAILAYKPHPDVVSRLRPGHALTEELDGLCDLVVGGLDIVPWLESCDEVHTLTSLSGFEALLRGKKVVCYGVPFYAGWGLTEDVIPPERRGMGRTLSELTAAALICYPRYINPSTGEFTTASGAASLIAARGRPLYSRPWYLRLVAALKTRLRRR